MRHRSLVLLLLVATILALVAATVRSEVRLPEVGLAAKAMTDQPFEQGPVR